jgi:hypothetical protein
LFVCRIKLIKYIFLIDKLLAKIKKCPNTCSLDPWFRLIDNLAGGPRASPWCKNRIRISEGLPEAGSWPRKPDWLSWAGWRDTWCAVRRSSEKCGRSQEIVANKSNTFEKECFFFLFICKMRLFREIKFLFLLGKRKKLKCQYFNF